MGIYLCKKHGRQGFYDMCGHIYSDLQKGIYPRMNTFPGFETKVCDDCRENLGLKDIWHLTMDDVMAMSEEKADLIDKRITPKYGQIPDRHQMCYKCIEEIRLNNS